MDKVKRYKWKLLEGEGELAWLDVNEINIDREYQRSLKEKKCIEISKFFSWPAFGVLRIAERHGKYYAFDGSHRLDGAKRRGDIKLVPCIIFKSEGQKEESGHFLLSNTGRKPVTANEKYKALITYEDKYALFVRDLLKRYGVKLKTTSGGNVKSIKTITRLLRYAKEDAIRTEKVIRIASLLCEKHFIHEKLLIGIFCLDRKLPEGVNERLEKRLLNIGPERLMESIRKACAFFGSTGDKVITDGMLMEINKNLRNKFEYTQSE